MIHILRFLTMVLATIVGLLIFHLIFLDKDVDENEIMQSQSCINQYEFIIEEGKPSS